MQASRARALGMTAVIVAVEKWGRDLQSTRTYSRTSAPDFRCSTSGMQPSTATHIYAYKDIRDKDSRSLSVKRV